MATPVYNNSGSTSDVVAAASLTLSSFAANAGSNRLLKVWTCTGSGSPVAPTGVTWGGQAMTHRGTALLFGTYFMVDEWFIKEASFPGGATGNVVASWAGSHDERVILAYCASDVDQTTPFRNASPTTATGNGFSPSVTISSNAADIVAGVVWIYSASGITASTGTSRQEIDSVGGYEGAGLSDRSGATPTLSWSLGGGIPADWGMVGESLIGATASGITFDAAGNSGDQAAANSYSGSAAWAGTNRLLAVDVPMLGAGVSVSSMTYGGAACTFVGAISTVTSFGRVEQWRICSSDSGAPAAGSNTLVVNLSGSLEFAAEWTSYAGVHQTSPTEAFNSAQATNTGSATDASVAITSVADNCWIHAACVANDTSITAGNTTRNNVSGTLGSGANEDNGAAKTPAGNVTMSYSGMGITTTWAIAGYAIRPIAASSLQSIVPILVDQYRLRRA